MKVKDIIPKLKLYELVAITLGYKVLYIWQRDGFCYEMPKVIQEAEVDEEYFGKKTILDKEIEISMPCRYIEIKGVEKWM